MPVLFLLMGLFQYTSGDWSNYYGYHRDWYICYFCHVYLYIFLLHFILFGVVSFNGHTVE